MGGEIKMSDHKIVIGTKEGKCLQRDLTDEEFEFVHRKKIGDAVSGDLLGYAGYEFQITGGSDKCGFPMRKGIQSARKKVLIGQGVGFNGKDRHGSRQGGLIRRKTVCGEAITKIIHQVNLRVAKEGGVPLPIVAKEKKAE